jgi:hypothetical protein
MALPPPPTRADPSAFAWAAWYNQLYTFLTTAGLIAWTQVNKAGSSIVDLQNHDHAGLTNVLGNGSYHLNATEQSRVAGFLTKAGAPTTSDIAAGQWALYKDSNTPFALRLWANDAGVMKSVTLT